MKTLSELSALIERLQTELQALKARIDALEEQLAALEPAPTNEDLDNPDTHDSVWRLKIDEEATDEVNAYILRFNDVPDWNPGHFRLKLDGEYLQNGFLPFGFNGEAVSSGIARLTNYEHDATVTKINADAYRIETSADGVLEAEGEATIRKVINPASGPAAEFVLHFGDEINHAYSVTADKADLEQFHDHLVEAGVHDIVAVALEDNAEGWDWELTIATYDEVASGWLNEASEHVDLVFIA